jgi:predicted Zn-dependent peptidase
MESSSARADQMARHLLAFGRIIPTEEIVARIDAITAADVVAVGRRILASPPTLAAVGPTRRVARADGVAARIGLRPAA